MRVAIFDRLEPAMPTNLPAYMVQSCSRPAAWALLALFVPLAIAIGSAAIGIAAAILSLDARGTVFDQPGIAVEVAIALTFLVFLAALPAKRLLDRLMTRRTIVIDEAAVTVTDKGYFSTETWSEPLTSFRGVAHHVRATLGATRHELVLVHPVRGKSVLLSVAAKTSAAELETVAHMLAQPVVPPSELYRFRSGRPGFSTAHLPDPAHA